MSVNHKCLYQSTSLMLRYFIVSEHFNLPVVADKNRRSTKSLGFKKLNSCQDILQKAQTVNLMVALQQKSEDHQSL